MKSCSMTHFANKLFAFPMIACHVSRIEKHEITSASIAVDKNAPVNVKELAKVCKAALGGNLLEYRLESVGARGVKIILKMTPHHWAFRDPYTIHISRLCAWKDVTGFKWKAGYYVRLCYDRTGYSHASGLKNTEEIKNCFEHVSDYLSGFVGRDGLTDWERSELSTKFNNFLDYARKIGIDITGSYEAKRHESWDGNHNLLHK